MKNPKTEKKSDSYYKHFGFVFFICVQTIHLFDCNPQVIFLPLYMPFPLWYYR